MRLSIWRTFCACFSLSTRSRALRRILSLSGDFFIALRTPWRPLALGARPGDEVGLLVRELLVVVARVPSGGRPLLEVGVVAAAVDRDPVLGQVELEDPGHAAGEELAVVADQHHAAAEAADEAPRAARARRGRGRWWARRAARGRSGSAAGRRGRPGRPARRRATSSAASGAHGEPEVGEHGAESARRGRRRRWPASVPGPRSTRRRRRGRRAPRAVGGGLHRRRTPRSRRCAARGRPRCSRPAPARAPAAASRRRRRRGEAVTVPACGSSRRRGGAAASTCPRR